MNKFYGFIYFYVCVVFSILPSSTEAVVGRVTATNTMIPPARTQISTDTVEGEQDTTRDVVIIGSGPSGCTAAIYAARAMLRPLVIAGMHCQHLE